LKAYVALREQVHYRRAAFSSGLSAVGYAVSYVLPCRPNPEDVLVIWNRYGGGERAALTFEKAGAKVLVAENGYLGKDWLDDTWYAIAHGQHNGAGRWPTGGPERWDSLGVELAPMRGGSEVVLLPQRGIGPAGVAMPRDWTDRTYARLRGRGLRVRVRQHPGTRECVPLERDLGKASAVVTWGSGAALKALVMGVPVFYDFPQWIGGPAASRFTDDLTPCVDARLEMFRRLAYAQWRIGEIADGTAFRHLLR
jgi:hypothetical protein